MHFEIADVTLEHIDEIEELGKALLFSAVVKAGAHFTASG